MDRLHAVTRYLPLGALCLFACDGAQSAPPPPVSSRVEAVAAKRPGDDALAGFCDVHAKAGHGTELSMPTTEPVAPAAVGARWVNIWATWCKPCIEELPMIANWQAKLPDASVVFVSVDAEPDAVDEFRAEHPDTPETLQMRDPEALSTWMASVGLDPGAGLPIHVFAGADGKVRCSRSGAVTETHFATIATLLR